jgi:hypothetical protein
VSGKAVETVTHFTIPRTPGAPALTPAEIVLEAVNSTGIYWLSLENVFDRKQSVLNYWRDISPAEVSYGKAMRGQLAAFRNGFCFLPTGVGPVFPSAPEIANWVKLVAMAYRDYGSVVAPEISEALDLAADVVEKAEELIQKYLEKRRPGYDELRSKLLAAFPKGGLTLSFVDLVDVKVQRSPHIALLQKALGVKSTYLHLTFEAATGEVSTITFCLEGTTDDFVDHFPIHPKYATVNKGNKVAATQEQRDKIALSFIRARAFAEALTFARTASDVQHVVVPEIGLDTYLPGPQGAREILQRMGDTAARISALPYADYRWSDPLAALREEAARA